MEFSWWKAHYTLIASLLLKVDSEFSCSALEFCESAQETHPNCVARGGERGGGGGGTLWSA